MWDLLPLGVSQRVECLVLRRLTLPACQHAVVWADGGYAGRLVGYARQVLKVIVDIVRKREG